jgi:hypothetical protein
MKSCINVSSCILGVSNTWLYQCINVSPPIGGYIIQYNYSYTIQGELYQGCLIQQRERGKAIYFL